MTPPLKIFALSGSLRGASYNSAALRACAELAPPGTVIDVFEGLREIPPYDDDVFKSAGLPAPVVDMRERIRAADALLVATPEYNHSIPGVLKNAIDWASRPPETPLMRKPTAIIGASMSMLGSARAQNHLRDVFVFFDAPVVNKPEVFIAQAHTKFDERGRLTDETARGLIAGILEGLARLALGLNSHGGRS